MRIRDRLTDGLPAPTPAEARLLQVLLADYPLGGIGTAASLAKKAGVSDPTVTRFVAKLGFAGFADFQAALLAEVEASLHSPLLMMEAKRTLPVQEDPVRATLRSAARQLADFADRMSPAVFEQAASLLLEAPGRIYLLGGRFSRHLAAILAAYMNLFREGVVDLGTCSSETVDRLADMGRRDVLVVFDYRRYQADVVAVATQAAARGIKLVLFTDPWMSPIAPAALHVLVAPTEVDSPFDTQLPPLAQVEALATLMISRAGVKTQQRMEQIEQARQIGNVTLDTTRSPPPGAGWPSPVEVVNPHGQSPVVLLCEHASSYIPPEYEGLGLPEAEIRRHIGWDIGAAAVATRLSALIDAPLFLAGYSRLLVDLNRPPGSPTAIPTRSEATEIPGNRNLTAQECQRRLDLIFAPFHTAVADLLDRRRAQGMATMLVTIHSFTPVYLGTARPWHAGILFNRSTALGEAIVNSLSQEADLVVVANEPYQITQDEDYAIPIHGEARGLDTVLVEIRNDGILDDDGAARWAERLARCLTDIIERQ